MADGELTRREREEILGRVRELDAQVFPRPPTPLASGAERARIKDAYYRALGEYYDRLPRVLMSVCPFTNKPLRRAFDPFGLDGPWWHKARMGHPDEPAAPSTFKVLLGAVDFGPRIPAEAIAEVIPGPDVPFVVPRLLRLPGMVAVIHRLALDTGELAYPIAYFSEEDIGPERLHQPWLRQDLWFKTEAGDSSWLISNDEWDFDLDPYIAIGKVWWVDERGRSPIAVTASSGARCPYVGLPGDRRPQSIAEGERELIEPPTGVPFNPFVE